MFLILNNYGFRKHFSLPYQGNNLTLRIKIEIWIQDFKKGKT